MPRKIEVKQGDPFGRLVIIQEVKSKKRRSFLCKCECGEEKVVQLNHLRSGMTTSCGCYQSEKAHESNVIDLTKKRFGQLLVLRKSGSIKNQSVEWECQCDCGNKKTLSARELIQIGTQSCGCLLNKTIQNARMVLYNDFSIDDVQIPLLKKKVRKDSGTEQKGIYYDKRFDTYRVSIAVKGKKIYLGTRKFLEDAIELRKAGEEKYHQPFVDKWKEENYKNNT
ncbi:hypothetical protein OCI51_26460 (plasmid) [Lysinibacillus capsici]|uniref:hypothetical protein n=1 Tax=Lysinibacillus capsici TaxID=2115968 RepID=UPI0021DA08E9|nr:hypothetical protein [Lysinibacillus capsici]UYB50153.1 hypothetical protein OCI51_26845 [Lysinibacillus capsici]UYB50228.1 hypothetical protein OCI51_26460 [Lysinibacillus capsici]